LSSFPYSRAPWLEVPGCCARAARAKRIPFSTEVHPGEQVEVEIRQILELEDLPVSPERVAAKKQLEQSKR